MDDPRAPYDPMPHGPDEVGVGPWPGAWPTGPQYDPDLLAHGDRRNVVDRYRYWSLEAIVADLDTRRHDFHVAIENWQHDFNIGTVVRNANAFMAAAVHVVGNRRWNRRGAMVTDRYIDVRHHATVSALAEWAAGERLELVGVDEVATLAEQEPADLRRRLYELNAAQRLARRAPTPEEVQDWIAQARSLPRLVEGG